MPSDTVWVAVLTGLTAVSASWVTSRGARQAAREQTQLSTSAQRHDRFREIRRTAYLNIIQHVQSLTPVAQNVSNLANQPPSESRKEGLAAELTAARKGFFTYLGFMRVISLEGPPSVARWAGQLGAEMDQYCTILEEFIKGNEEDHQQLDLVYASCETSFLQLVEEAAKTIQAM
ncbi:hypothetical protein OG824_20500 [Streptomyces prunicolor]|uniref:hypothetical protein n=1 Tax=Streptomyces prunicolor TaxID=67348 RepID=UPI00225396C9|nr:hypothetical protein [Streptomyces prunicolor]MCX5237586.1 hypothetical protein [Streptomyces prunicolor]